MGLFLGAEEAILAENNRVLYKMILLTIIFHQIEENTRVLETLGQRFGTPAGYYGSMTADEDDRGTPRGRHAGKGQEKWKTGAKKALLQWCQNQVEIINMSGQAAAL